MAVIHNVIFWNREKTHDFLQKKKRKKKQKRILRDLGVAAKQG